MQTKQSFFIKSALVVAAAAALGSCAKEKIAIDKPDEMRFVLNVASPDDTGTRALKEGWETGDKIVVFFDAAAGSYAFFNYDGTDWVLYNNIVSTSAIQSGGGPLQALHAGNPAFDFDGTTVTNISGDILLDQDGGTYTVDAGTNTAYINLVMERDFTTVIKMQGSGDATKNADWRLAGRGLKVMGSNTSQTAANLVQNPDFYIQALFVDSDASSGAAAVPDAEFTDATQAVFHVWDDDSENAGTSIDVYDSTNHAVIYNRVYTNDLTVGSTTIIMAPDAAGEETNWTNTSLTPVSSTAVALDGIAAPVGGATPATTATAASTDFTPSSIVWNPADAAFVAGTVYTATVTLASAADKTFQGSGFDNVASVAGFTAGGQSPSAVVNNGATLVLTYTYPAADDELLAAAALTGVAAPEAGATPDTAITTASTQFTAALDWSDASNVLDGNGQFAQGTVYTATITLTAAAGYTFTGDFTNTATIAGFTVNGAAPTAWTSNDGTTLVFTYAFPATSANQADYAPTDDDVTLN